MAITRPSLVGVLVIAAVLSGGCMVGSKYKQPSAPVPPAFKEAPPQGWKEAQPNDGVIRGKWWEIFHDPVLNALEEQVAISNQNVLAAEANYRSAKAAVRVARSALFPAVTVAPAITVSQSGGGGSRGLISSGTGVINSGGVSGINTFYSLPFDVTWQADIWGSIRRSVNSNTDLAQASDADLENARLLYQSELASDYFQLRGVDAEQNLFVETVRSYRDYVELTRHRFEGGIATDADVAQAETQLYDAQTSLTELGVQRTQLEHAIAVLIGKPPARLEIAPASLSYTPPVIPLTVPSTLLERRPDIAGAERRVASANEQIGIAKAALYPTLTLSGTAGFQNSSFTNWLIWPSRFWSAGPQLAQTLFDAGRRRATMQEAEAQYDSLAATYRQTVLTAFQQVEDNLSALRILQLETAELDRAIAAARRNLAVSSAQYKAGTNTYLQVIIAQAALLQDQVNAIVLLTRRMTASVLLIQALGGGWDAIRLPSPAEVRSSK
jgi:NodT family efflux transporter outer membrane factor (OMF) lipoprotein